MSRARDLADGTFTGTVTASVDTTGDFNFYATSDGGGAYRIYPDDATTANPVWQHQSNSNESQSWVIGGVERMRVLSSGGLTFNGDTAAANALDDYEEGTFTPTVVGDSTAGTTTYAQQYGYYTKVGNQVSIVIQLNYTSLTGTGFFKIGNLPFTSANSTQNYAPMSVLPSNLNWSAGTQVVALQFQNTSNIYLYGVADDSQAAPLTCVNEAASFRLSGTYLTS